MFAVVADSGTVQALTSLAMAPKPRLFFLTNRRLQHPSPTKSAPILTPAQGWAPANAY